MYIVSIFVINVKNKCEVHVFVLFLAHKSSELLKF